MITGLGASLRGANLTNASLQGDFLGATNFTGANLSGATFLDGPSALLEGIDTTANLANDNLTAANLSGANLTDANLNGAFVKSSDLYGVSSLPTSQTPSDAALSIHQRYLVRGTLHMPSVVVPGLVRKEKNSRRSCYP